LKKNFHQFKTVTLHKEKEMSHFRKMLFAAAAVATFIGSAGSASAQTNPFVCNTSFSPLVVRVEGLRELVGDIVITCTGGNALENIINQAGSPANGVVATPGTPTGVGGAFVPINNPTVPAINISVTIAGTRITNRIFGSSNLTDALLFIDEPVNPVTGGTRSNQNPCQNTSTTVGTAGVCTGMSYFFESGLATGAGYPSAAAPNNGTAINRPINVYQAQYGVGGGFAPNEQTITFVGVPIVQPGPNGGTRVYRIKNIRVQVANAFQVNGQIQAFISVQNPPANLVLNNAQGVVGFVQRGLFFDTIAGGPYAQCLGWNATSSGGYPTEGSGSLISTGALRFTEAYGVAFKRNGYGAFSTLDAYDPVYNQFWNQGQTNPTVNYNNESGFYNRTWEGTTNNNLGDVGRASNGTRLRARFSGVPAQVRVYVTIQPITTPSGCSSTLNNISTGSGTAGFCVGQGAAAPNAAYAVSGLNADGAGSFVAVSTTAFGVVGSAFVQGTTAPGWGGGGAAYTGLNTTPRFARVTIAADGTGTYFWEVLRADDNVIDRFDFLVAIAFPPTTSIVTDANTSVVANVSGNFAPIAATGGNGFPSIPTFVLTQPEELRPIFTITNCATNLLYPFVSSVTGFNTGIAVANVSKDPFGTVNETGICRVFFYGTTAGGGIDPTPQSFSKSVPSGQVATFNLLFGGPEYGIQPVVGFQGYVIISCNFRWAHGFAFISDPSNLQTAHGYLALILDPPGLRRNTGATLAEALDN
jgi:hypothetical protein